MSLESRLSFIIFCIVACCPRAVANDNFADAIDVTAQPLTYYRYVGGTGTAEPGEPAHAGNPAAQSFWFQWQAPADKVMAFGEYLNGNSARIGIYTGTAVNSLALVAQGTGRVFFAAQAGVRYWIAVDSPAADYIYLREYPQGGADDRTAAEAIAGSPPFQIRGNNIFATAAADDPDFGSANPANHSVWWVWTAPSNGALRVDSRLCDFGPGLTVFERPPGGVATKIGSGLDSVGFAVTAGRDYLICVDAFNGAPGEISLWFDNVPTGPPPNDNIANAIDLGSGLVTCDGGWLLFATPEAGLPNETLGQWGLPGDRTMWWKWTCPRGGDFRFSTLGSNLFAGVYLYTGGPGALSYVASNDDLSGVRITAAAGTTYWIQVRTPYFRTVSRAEINIHPAVNSPPYFNHLNNRGIFRLMGRDRHPGADPDGDGFANELECAFGSNPQVHDSGNPNLPHLLSNGAGGWMLQWKQDSSYLQSSVPYPMTLLPKIANSPAGPWTTGVPALNSQTGMYSCNLPVGTTGFGRFEFFNPNWSPDP